MQALEKGRLRARLAESAADIVRAQTLRQQLFRPGSPGLDADRFDALCDHVLVEERDGGRLLSCFRLQVLPGGGALERSYCAQFYDLAPLAALQGPMVEMGRFCVAPGLVDPDILRLGWAAMTRIVDAAGAGLLFGCSSFHGADPQAHAAALAALVPHVAAPGLRPGRRAPETVPLPETPQRAPATGLPPLLRTYLAMGGWVSDHAVIDRDLDTLHVFTGVEVAAVPAARARALRVLAG